MKFPSNFKFLTRGDFLRFPRENFEIFEFIEAQINPSGDFCEGLDSIEFTSNTNIGFWSGLPNSDSTTGWFISNNLSDGSYEIYYSIYGSLDHMISGS